MIFKAALVPFADWNSNQLGNYQTFTMDMTSETTNGNRRTQMCDVVASDWTNHYCPDDLNLVVKSVVFPDGLPPNVIGTAFYPALASSDYNAAAAQIPNSWLIRGDYDPITDSGAPSGLKFTCGKQLSYPEVV